ncbi:hypothetical protein [Escherichia coli]
MYREMEFAKAYGNWHRVQGLHWALQRIEKGTAITRVGGVQVLKK